MIRQGLAVRRDQAGSEDAKRAAEAQICDLQYDRPSCMPRWMTLANVLALGSAVLEATQLGALAMATPDSYPDEAPLGVFNFALLDFNYSVDVGARTYPAALSSSDRTCCSRGLHRNNF